MLAAACGGSDSDHARGTGTKGGLERLAVQAKLRLPGEPQLLTVAGSRLWLSFIDDGSVAAVDPATNRLGPRIRLSRGAGTQFDNPLAGDDRELWAVDNATDRLVRLDARTGAVRARIDVEAPIELTVAFGSVWVALFDGYKVIRLDPHGDRVAARVSAAGPTDVAAGADSLWVLAHRADQVLRVDPATNRVAATITLRTRASTPERLAFGEGALWVTDPPGNSVTRIDPAANRTTVEVVLPGATSYPFQLATGGGYVWVAGELRVFRIDPRSNKVTGMAQLASKINPDFGALTDVEYAFGSVWVVDRSTRTLFRLDPAGVGA